LPKSQVRSIGRRCYSSLGERGLSISFLLAVASLVAVVGYIILDRGQLPGWSRTRSVTTIVAPAILQPSLKPLVGVFAKNHNIFNALLQNGLSRQEAHQLVETTRPVYNLAKITAGRPYWLYFTPEGQLHDFRYIVDDERYLTVYREGKDYVPLMKRFEYETRAAHVSGIIEDSLFLTVKRGGEQEQLAQDLADVFTWDVDFYTDVKKGDSFRILVEKKYLEGKFTKYGPILAASLTNQGKTHYGFRFADESGVAGYYTPDGRPLKRSFLKSPLKFARISSRFSRARLHPILKIVRPHMGIDYAAPIGTPVVAVAAGRVEFAGASAGSGKVVKMRHAQGYETIYLHLSRIAVRAGRSVSQGEIIGWVGATGLATGPHLDFRILQHGRFVNPTRVVFPPAPPLSSTALTRFSAVRDVLQKQLQQLSF
jgi:murein DD-endopeptidase MepM/ murein hydrolase activator NlpD